MTYPHIPVLLHEVLAAFQDVHLDTFVDGTLGAGGHCEALLKTHSEIKTLLGIDQDETALEIAKTRLYPWQSKLILEKNNFENLKTVLKKHSICHVNGILLDIGVSSMQLDRDERGFSFMREGPLDMRMDLKGSLKAEEIVNTWSEEDLGKIFREYGEEKQWKLAARTIVEKRKNKPILTTKELSDALSPLFYWKKKGINPLTLIFQALRIAVNNELEVLEKVLDEAIGLLHPGGRLAIITFHSLEDRIVKNKFRYFASDKENTSGLSGLFIDKKPTVKLITKKALSATDEEMKNNPRSRSAKLRVIEKL